MNKHIRILIAFAILIVLSVALTSSVTAKSKKSAGVVIACKFNVTQPALPPSQPTGQASGPCVVFGTVNDNGSGTSTFTLIGNPPKAVHGVQTLTGAAGTLTGKFQGSTAPISFNPGPPPPTVAEAVAIARFTVTKASGGFARLKGKSGVTAAYTNNGAKTLTASVIL